MSVLDKQNKTQLTHMGDMFRVSVCYPFNNSSFPSDKSELIHNLENEIKRIYSKDILSTISKIGKNQRYCFAKSEKVDIYFSICDYYTSIYDEAYALGQLQLQVKVNFIFKDNENMHAETVYYKLTIHILTDEAREFVLKSIQNLKK
jgi:hypothetical protein